MYSTLIDVSQLGALLGRPEVVILDCRFELAAPEAGAAQYAAGHIPGAQYAHLDRDLSGKTGPATGRHPLPDPERLAITFGRWGINSNVQVIAYDGGPGAYAARAWWLLRWMGHEAVAVLNGGFAAWHAAGLAVETYVRRRDPRLYTPRLQVDRSVAVDEVMKQRDAGAIQIVDARGADRFAGENETLDPVAGHVPGAKNRPFTANLGPDGRFLAVEALRGQWEALLAGRPVSELVSMCGSGVTACHNLLALEHAGLPGARLYAGSWSEWVRDPLRPVATGRDPVQG
ncbi:MAG: putative thiosulfate sulfurtransferase SseB [Steroidobacteraceae bacterium]|nr:putative thiosulfate sulfurtransferase SseB [Steroidobacteraceae bacterium]